MWSRNGKEEGKFGLGTTYSDFKEGAVGFVSDLEMGWLVCLTLTFTYLCRQLNVLCVDD